MRLGSLAILVTACGSSPPAKPPAPVQPARLLTIADLERAGATTTKISDTETLVCGPNDGECVCMKDLSCSGTSCITLAANLDGFKQALKRDTNPVYCELADTGQFCDLSYFRFEGDIYRWETRYFGPDGHLVGQTNATDYPEYCGGKAMRQFTGRIPDCSMQPRKVEKICADPRFAARVGKLGNPREFVMP